MKRAFLILAIFALALPAGAFAIALFLVGATTVFLRRRLKPAARMAGSPS